MADTIATLGGLGWTPIAPNKWKRPDLSTLALEYDSAGTPHRACKRLLAETPNHIRLADEEATDEIRDAVRCQIWTKAAEHYMGQGLGNGHP